MKNRKKITKRIAGHKKMSKKTGKGQPRPEINAISLQFRKIQKTYSKLLMDITKEVDLIKDWIEKQTVLKRNGLKDKFIAKT